MKNFIAAFRKGKKLKEKYGGSYIFWDPEWYGYRVECGAWRAIPNPKIPKSSDIFILLK